MYRVQFIYQMIKTEDLDKTTYKIVDDQNEINAIIDAITGNEVSSICMHNNGVTLHFSHIEVSDDIVTCYLTTFSGNYTLLLSKEEGLSELSHSKTV